jgi:hypothetical protein
VAGPGEVGLVGLGTFMGSSETSGASRVGGVTELDCRPCGEAWSGAWVWVLVRLPWLDDDFGFS